MRISHFSRYTLGVCAAAMLAGCGGGSGTPLSPSPAGVTAERTHVRPAYSVIYSFKGGTGDGQWPSAGLLNVKGTFYGTTSGGGANYAGTVFSVTTSGAETVLYSFKGVSGDGAYPDAGLINVNGTLYGTTGVGGANGFGTVFAITPSGKETVLYSFGAGREGAYPQAGLINVNGMLYGTTGAGGAYGGAGGTVFKITTSGTETVLHRFKGRPDDGADPLAGLLKVKGTLYGTTADGGASRVGTVFSITPSGKETVLHSFGTGSADGAAPYAGLINVNGTLYGTTSFGGANNYGTVFSLSP